MRYLRIIPCQLVIRYLIIAFPHVHIYLMKPGTRHVLMSAAGINDAIIAPNYIASPIEYTVIVWQTYVKLIHRTPNNWSNLFCFNENTNWQWIRDKTATNFYSSGFIEYCSLFLFIITQIPFVCVQLFPGYNVSPLYICKSLCACVSCEYFTFEKSFSRFDKSLSVGLSVVNTLPVYRHDFRRFRLPQPKPAKLINTPFTQHQ